jgi:predicted methyltransferase MtxX (methanogen marker protein 4)
MKIGIGCGVNPEKVIQSAGKSASPDVEIICYVKEGTEFSVPEFVSINYSECPEKSLVDDLYSKKIDAAVRGSLPANDTLKYLKKVYDVSRLERIALLETSAGQKFFFAPVGVDEGCKECFLQARECAFAAGWVAHAEHDVVQSRAY